MFFNKVDFLHLIVDFALCSCAGSAFKGSKYFEQYLSPILLTILILGMNENFSLQISNKVSQSCNLTNNPDLTKWNLWINWYTADRHVLSLWIRCGRSTSLLLLLLCDWVQQLQLFLAFLFHTESKCSKSDLYLCLPVQTCKCIQLWFRCVLISGGSVHKNCSSKLVLN